MIETKPAIQAHRGNSSAMPENTLAAFERALADGAPWIEFDVHLSADNELVVMHDAKVDRTTNGHGALREMTLAEIKQLDAGAWFAPDFAGQRVPTLDEVITAVNRRARLNVEIKELDPETCCAERVVERLLAAGILEESVISCFDLPVLLAARGKAPQAALQLLGRGDDILEPALENKLAWFGAHFRTVNPNMIRRAHEAGVLVDVWTVDEISELERWARGGADFITTNKPDVFLAYLREKSEAGETRS